MSRLKVSALFLFALFGFDTGFVHAASEPTSLVKAESKTSLVSRGDCSPSVGVLGKIGRWVLQTDFGPVAYLRDRARARARRTIEILPDEKKYFHEVKVAESHNGSDYPPNFWEPNKAAILYVKNGLAIPDVLSTFPTGSLILLRAHDGRELVGRLIKSENTTQLLVAQEWHSKHRKFLVHPDWLEFKEVEVSLSEEVLFALRFSKKSIEEEADKSNEVGTTLVQVTNPLVRDGVLASLDYDQFVAFFANDGGPFSLRPLGGGYLSHDLTQLLHPFRGKSRFGITPTDWTNVDYLQVNTQVALPRYSGLETPGDAIQSMDLNPSIAEGTVYTQSYEIPGLQNARLGDVVTLDLSWDQPLTGVLTSKVPLVVWVLPFFKIDKDAAEAGDKKNLWKAQAMQQGLYLTLDPGDRGQIKKAIVGWAHTPLLMEVGRNLQFFKAGKLQFEGNLQSVGQDGRIAVTDRKTKESHDISGIEVRALEVKREPPSLALFREIFGKETEYGVSVFHEYKSARSRGGDDWDVYIKSYAVYQEPRNDERLRIVGVFRDELGSSGLGGDYRYSPKRNPPKRGEPFTVQIREENPQWLESTFGLLSNYQSLRLFEKTFEVVVQKDGRILFSIWDVDEYQVAELKRILSSD